MGGSLGAPLALLRFDSALVAQAAEKILQEGVAAAAENRRQDKAATAEEKQLQEEAAASEKRLQAAAAEKRLQEEAATVVDKRLPTGGSRLQRKKAKSKAKRCAQLRRIIQAFEKETTLRRQNRKRKQLVRKRAKAVISKTRFRFLSSKSLTTEDM